MNVPLGISNMLLLLNVILTLWVSCAHAQGRTCDFPEIKHGTIYDENSYKQIFPVDIGKYFYYTCDHSFVSPSQLLWNRIICTQEGWSPRPKCLNSQGKCGPPPPIDNGDTTSFPAPVYPPGSTVEYQCQSYYELQGNRYVVCQNGEWSEPPKCLDACVISEEIMKKHNIQLKWRRDKKLYSKTDDTVEFTCKRGYYRRTPNHTFRTSCQEGKLAYPICG
ncbi:complement factor H-related protein 2-like isoform X2 [Eschrichtius robustus]|uniref:complement factor H-related protein 2-like isoform X2 n=1 Tax=Eschrichtius robustus TaxID=9764 RepID=UPI0035C0D4AA